MHRFINKYNVIRLGVEPFMAKAKKTIYLNKTNEDLLNKLVALGIKPDISSICDEAITKHFTMLTEQNKLVVGDGNVRTEGEKTVISTQ